MWYSVSPVVVQSLASLVAGLHGRVGGLTAHTPAAGFSTVSREEEKGRRDWTSLTSSTRRRE